jgi:MYXO-CTERM domain-containing protein
VITRVAWSEDGTLYVASDEGLYKSTDEGKTLHRVGSAEYLSCVIEREGALLVCGYYAGIPAGNPGIGISRDGGETFTRYMNLNMVAQPLKCDPMSTTGSACALPWTDWQNELLIGLDGGVPLAGGPGLAGAAGAAGSADAGIAAGQSGAPSAGTSALDAGLAGSGAATARSAASGCSCQLTGGPAPLPRTAAVGFGIAVLLLRSRRRRLVRRDQDQRSDPDRPTSGAFGAKLPSQCPQPELERTRWHSR